MSTSSTATSSVITAVATSGSRLGPHPISVKLDDANYFPWKQQAMATIKGYKLQRYFLGAHAIPKKFNSTEDEASGKINEDFLSWEQQDQLLLSWILSSVSDGLLPKLVGCHYSYEAWNKLETYFASQTRAKVRQFKAQLKNMKKGTMGANEYLLKIKRLVDSLFSVGSPLTNNDHIEAILEGLPEEYNSFVVSITSRLDPYSLDEIESLLVAQEEPIEKFKKEQDASSFAPMSANFVQSQNKNMKGSQNSQSSQNNGNFNQNTRGGSSNFRGRGRNTRGRGAPYNSSRPQCQVCGKVGHMAWQCYFRFDQQYISPFATAPQQSFNGNFRPPTANMVAMYTAPETGYDAAWYPDSRATNHVTPHTKIQAIQTDGGDFHDCSPSIAILPTSSSPHDISNTNCDLSASSTTNPPTAKCVLQQNTDVHSASSSSSDSHHSHAAPSTEVAPISDLVPPVTATNLHPMTTRAKAGIFKPKTAVKFTTVIF
ncbi:Retrovirus-related Pol polyprotein from transposon TNT 1-94 [Senna tora]|uniref:Retrovirus-related Pol polyprotein from transposon TNT 1-94 n=1 Tax=Senna tora TaxID=362788 RepID=A0A835CDX5_9FABA|nr:Retrovirus-related Pol polyprotein from transposon TNT 1-94 [Senna tora]